MAGGGGGGWMSPMRTVGGIGRTYGLQDNFSKAKQEGPAPDLMQAPYRRILKYFRPYRREWASVLACEGVSALLNLLPPLCMAAILDHAIPRQHTLLLALLAGFLIGLAVLTGLIGVLQQSLTAHAGECILYDLRNELFRHLQGMSLNFYVTNRSGEIVSRISNDVNAVQGVAARTIVSIFSNVMTLIATAGMLLFLNWRLALLAVLVVPAFYLPSLAVGRIRRRLALQSQNSQAALLALMQERLHVGGALLTKIFGQAEADAEAFRAESDRMRELNVRQAVVGRWLFMVLSVFSVIGPALIFWYGGLQVIQRELTLGQLVAFAALLTLLYKPLMQLATVYVDVQASVAVFERIFEYLDLRPGVEDRPGALALATTRGRLVFENVSFAYPRTGRPESGGGAAAAAEDEDERNALSGVSFELAPGERVALVGRSGAGKTTVTYLVPRLYDPCAGRVLLDGQDLRTLTQDSLRSHIAMVTQETFLFHATLRENLLYARPGAMPEDIEAACRAAQIHDFIAGLPAGYATVVGERGFRLSGGEKQRVSIARALLKDPALIILDEATSSLDATSEHLIQQALEKLLQGRTALVIAHRLSTILSADKIVVLEHGRVTEMGRHAELLETDGLYSELFHQQFSKVLESTREAAD